MRPIDAEHLKWNVGGIKCGTLTVAYLNWILEHEEPTVEAIPIDWIESQVDKGKWAELVQRWAERKDNEIN